MYQLSTKHILTIVLLFMKVLINLLRLFETSNVSFAPLSPTEYVGFPILHKNGGKKAVSSAHFFRLLSNHESTRSAPGWMLTTVLFFLVAIAVVESVRLVK